jgi:hypothetical protein
MTSLREMELWLPGFLRDRTFAALVWYLRTEVSSFASISQPWPCQFPNAEDSFLLPFVRSRNR